MEDIYQRALEQLSLLCHRVFGQVRVVDADGVRLISPYMRGPLLNGVKHLPVDKYVAVVIL